MLLFIVVLVLLAYTWLLYPAVMIVLGRDRKSAGWAPVADKELPPVVVVFSAHNEEKVIGARLANLLALDYPADRLRIRVGVDGCIDRTEPIAREWAARDPRIQVTVRERCAGKTSMLKALVAGCKMQDPASSIQYPGSLLLFTDANTFFEKDALRQLVAPFADPRVGGVCGRLVLQEKDIASREDANNAKRDGVASAEGGKGMSSSLASRLRARQSSSSFPTSGTDETSYWNLETLLKRGESALDSCLGANGAIYAIRAKLFPSEMPDNTIIDDFVIGMKVREQGVRLVYEPAAVAREDLPATVRDEWRRRVRIGSGAYQALALCRACLAPRFGVFAWMFWSHKVLRWVTPHLMVGLMVIGCWLLGGWALKTDGAVLNLVGVGVACVLLAALVLSALWRPFGKVMKLAWYFLVMQAALFAGFVRYCRGNLSGTWVRTERG